jgi:hypothetical protein
MGFIRPIFIIVDENRRMRKNFVSLLLIVHGLIHIMFQFEVVNPDTGEHVGWNGTSWLLSNVINDQIVILIGRIFWALATILFMITGVVLLMEKMEWRTLDIVASGVSLVAFILFWSGLVPHPLYYIVGPSVAILTFVALLIVRWPPDSWIFESQIE